MSTALLTARESFEDTQAAAVAAGQAAYDRRQSREFNHDVDTLDAMLDAGTLRVDTKLFPDCAALMEGHRALAYMVKVVPQGGTPYCSATVLHESCPFDVAVIAACMDRRAAAKRGAR